MLPIWPATVIDRTLQRVGISGRSKLPPCPLCSTPASRVACELKPPYRLLYCPGCDLGYVDPMPTTTELTEFYESDAYFSGGHEGFGFTNQVETGDKLRDSLLWGWPYLDELEKITVTRGKILDVGCGTGFRLSVAKARGWEPNGVELSEFAAGVANERYAVNVKNCRLSDADFDDDTFDAVMINAVLEHVPDPIELLVEATRVLKPGGGMAILLPHYGSPRSKMRGADWNEIRPPEHLTFHSHASIRVMAEAAGLEVVNISSHPKYHVTPAELAGCVPGKASELVEKAEEALGLLPAKLLRDLFIEGYHRTLQFPLITAWFRHP